MPSDGRIMAMFQQKWTDVGQRRGGDSRPGAVTPTEPLRLGFVFPAEDPGTDCT
jgi:hypothetical protein